MVYREKGLAGYLAAEQPGYWGLLTSAQLAGLGQELGQTLYTDCRAVADWLATTSARPDASRHGAGPPRKGSAASEPLVRWRCNSFSTKETETLNWAATAPLVRPGC